MHTFDRDGVTFQYPTNWGAEAEESDDGTWSVTLSSPGTAFVLIALRPDARDPADLADQTLDALRAEYIELDAANVVETLAGRVAIGHDIDFMTVDTAIVCRTRCLDSQAGPLLTMTQVSDFDREQNDPVLRAIIASIKVEDD